MHGGDWGQGLKQRAHEMARTFAARCNPMVRTLTALAACIAGIGVAVPIQGADDVIGSDSAAAQSPSSSTGSPKSSEPKTPPAHTAPKTSSIKFVWMKPTLANKTLADDGLKRLKPAASAIHWVLADDAKVSGELADFVSIAAANDAAEKKAKDESSETSADMETLEKAEARYKELKGYAERPNTIPRAITARFRDPQEMMQALNKEVDKVVETINTLQPKLQGKFAEDMPPEQKAAITNWMLARSRLIIAAMNLSSKSDFAALDAKYKSLTDDANVVNALRSLGKKNRLMSADFEQTRDAMTEAESAANSGDVPFYREGSYDSVGIILNESIPLVIRIDALNPNTPNWAPAVTLAKAGVAPDPSSPTVILTATINGKKRVIQCHEVTVPKLRFGKYVVESVKFLAMPDDAKDLGAEMVSTVLNDYDKTADRKTWLYRLAPKSQSGPDEKSGSDKLTK